jgi:FG-GAP-like repeat/Abnormal spindle-like microcephaly-assoc'd, ASPM-SPD-2-Hydin
MAIGHSESGKPTRRAIHNGDGSFQPQSQYPVNGTNNLYLIVADLNRDGKLDLAVAETGGAGFVRTGNGSVSVLLGNGDGTFHSGGSYATGGVSISVTAADFNGDGILDLATANYTSSSISLLLGNGDGTFRAPLKYPAGDGARGMAVGDFNGDGRLDLAVGNQFVDSISIFLQSSLSVTLTPARLPFLLLRTVGTTSPTQTVKLTNVGSAGLNITGITLTGPNSGDFAQSNNCPRSPASGANCLITVTFTPTAQGVRTASISIADSAPGSPQTVPLTGRGTFLEWSPRSLNMGDQPVGTSSAAGTVTLTNAGPAPITLYSIEIDGLNPGDFTQTNTCGSSLKAGASCTIEVTFTPKAVGSRQGHVTIRDNAFGGTHWVGLLGKGT